MVLHMTAPALTLGKTNEALADLRNGLTEGAAVLVTGNC